MIVTDGAATETLTIRTFGQLAIHLGDAVQPAAIRTIKFETHAAEALLIYLAFHGRPLGRDELAELLWPERTQKEARSVLRITIFRLRQQLAPYLLVTRQSIALDPNARIELDARRFESHLAAGQLAQATALYRDDFLNGFYLDSSPDFEQWALRERERMRISAITAHQQLIDQTVAAGQLDAAIANAQRLLQLDPLHEPAHRQLMRLLAQGGQRSAALTHYESFCQLLTVELDVAPDETTVDLSQQIRSGEFDKHVRLPANQKGLPASASGSGSPDQPMVPSINNLPSQPTPFIGRDAEVAQVEKLLSNPDCRLLTLLGVGGIGKTRLALASAVRQANYFVDGLCFVPLAPVATAELMVVAIAQSLGLQFTSSNLEAEVAAYLRPHQYLLILDNFEHLLGAADTVAHLLQSAPRLKVLVTSRERLNLREEWLLPIAGLSLAKGVAGEAGQLFVHSAQRVHPDFTSQGQEEAIAAICRQVEGMPLALELAASWVRVMSCAEIAHQLQENLNFLSTTLRNVPERHRNMRALFDQSWRLLSALEQGVLMRLSVFQGGWALEEAASVTGATLTLLLGLVDKSLVRVGGQMRFDLHELVRQYAAEQLVANGEVNLIRERHYAAYLQLFRRGDGPLRGAEATTWLARLNPEQDNVRAALQWAFGAGRYVDVAWLMVVILWHWHMRGHWFEYGKLLARLLPHRQMLIPDLRLMILLCFYSVARAMEEFQPVEQWTDEVRQLLEQCSDKLLHAAVWHFWAHYAADFPQAATAWERSIVLADAAGEAPGLGAEFGLVTDRGFVLATSMRSYASRLIEYGEFTRAETLSRESLSFFQSRASRYEVTYSLSNLGHLALLQGDLAQATSYLMEAVTLAAAFNYREVLCNAQPLLGLVTLFNGDADKAEQLLNEGLRFCLELRGKSFLAWTCTYLAEVALWVGELEGAAQWLAQSLAHEADWRRITIYDVGRLFVAARLATAQFRYLQAAALFGLAERAHSQVHNAIGGPVRSLANRALAKVRDELDSGLFDQQFAAGQQLPLADAYATLLMPSYLGDEGSTQNE